MNKIAILLIMIGVSHIASADSDSVSQQIQLLNSQIQAQFQKVQSEQQSQIQTLNKQIQTQLKQMQTDLQAQIEKANTITQEQLKQLETGLQTRIKTVQQAPIPQQAPLTQPTVANPKQ